MRNKETDLVRVKNRGERKKRKIREKIRKIKRRERKKNVVAWIF